MSNSADTISDLGSSGKKVVLFVLPSMAGGGAEKVTTTLIKHLSRNEFELHLALGSRTGEFLNEIPKDTTVHILGSERARSAVFPLVRLIRKLRPHTVYSTLGMNFAVAAAKPFIGGKTRVVLREGSSPSAFLKDVERLSKTKARIYRAIYKTIYKQVDQIICQSNFMHSDLAENFSLPLEKLVTIYNPVDSDVMAATISEEHLKNKMKAYFIFLPPGVFLTKRFRHFNQRICTGSTSA